MYRDADNTDDTEKSLDLDDNDGISSEILDYDFQLFSSSNDGTVGYASDMQFYWTERCSKDLLKIKTGGSDTIIFTCTAEVDHLGPCIFEMEFDKTKITIEVDNSEVD